MATPKSILSAEHTTKLRDFETYLFARFHLEDSTIENYVGCIKRMFMEIGDRPTQDQADLYFASMRRRKMSYTYAGYVAVAMERYGEFIGVPITLGRPPRPQRVLKNILSEAEVTLLIAATKTDRDRALLAILAFSGIRNQELTKLKIGDIDLAGGTIHIAGKGSRERKSCVSGTCMQAVVEYLHKRQGMAEDLLFVTSRNSLPLETQDVRKLVLRIAKRAGIKKRVHPHLFRHSLATNMLIRGASIIAIRDQLGHEFLQTTMLYLHATVEDLKTDYRKYHPRYM